MRTLPRSTRFVAVSAALTLGLAACGSGTDDATEQAATPVGSEAPSTTTPNAPAQTEAETPSDSTGATASVTPFADLEEAVQVVGHEGTARALASGIVEATGMEGDISTPAVQTYATLSTLLQEHVYLAGITIDTGLGSGLDSPQFEAAAATLDANSVALADTVGSVAPGQRDAFLELWRTHIGFFVDYTKGAAAGDDQAIQTALDDLSGYRDQAGAFFEEISGGAIPADAVKQSLSGHVDTLTQAIDAAAAGDATVFEHLKAAATHVGEGGSAKALAGGIAQATGMEGDIDSPAAQTYVTLSTVLEEHVYLSGITVKTAYAAGLDSPAFEAAAATLDTNSVALADLVGSVAPDQRDAFLELWRTHIGFFVDYAKGAASGDEQAKQAALDDLSGYGDQSAAFFDDISGGVIQPEAVKQSLTEHVDTLSAAIDSLATVLAS